MNNHNLQVITLILIFKKDEKKIPKIIEATTEYHTKNIDQNNINKNDRISRN